MNFFSELQIRYTDFDLSSQKNKILEILANGGIHEDVYSSLITAFNDGKEGLNIDPIYYLELIEKIAELFPNSNFECHGLGEEFLYTWILCIENGQVVFKNRPWGNKNPFV